MHVVGGIEEQLLTDKGLPELKGMHHHLQSDLNSPWFGVL